MRQSLGLIALILFVAGLSFVLSAQDQQNGRQINITMAGADPDGTGTARLTFNQGKNQVCSELTFDKIAPPNGAHIHSRIADLSGPPVVTLTPKGCAPLEHGKIMDILKNPGTYYVDVHNSAYPNGASARRLNRS